MSWSETPIYPGKPIVTPTNIPGSAASTYTIFTANATYGGVVYAARLFTKTVTARTVRLELKDGSTVAILSRFSTGTTQYASFDLVSSTYMPLNSDSVLILAPGQTLQIVTEDTNAGTLDASVFGASFEYPN